MRTVARFVLVVLASSVCTVATSLALQWFRDGGSSTEVESLGTAPPVLEDGPSHPSLEPLSARIRRLEDQLARLRAEQRGRDVDVGLPADAGLAPQTMAQGPTEDPEIRELEQNIIELERRRARERAIVENAITASPDAAWAAEIAPVVDAHWRSAVGDDVALQTECGGLACVGTISQLSENEIDDVVGALIRQETPWNAEMAVIGDPENSTQLRVVLMREGERMDQLVGEER